MHTITIILGTYIIINFISILMYFPNGFYYNTRGWPWNYFLGYKNAHIYFYLPYIYSALIGDRIRRGRLKAFHIVMFFVIFLSSVISNASTAIVIVSLISVLLIFMTYSRDHKLININKSLIVSVLLSAAFIFFNFQRRFENIINQLFGKDVTFTKRVSVWASALFRIIRHPFIGNGSSEIISITNDIGNMGHAHNMYLDVLYIGGLLSLIVFLLIIARAGRAVENVGDEVLRKYVTIASIGYFVLFLMEANRTNASFYLLIGICLNLPQIEHNMVNYITLNNEKLANNSLN